MRKTLLVFILFLTASAIYADDPPKVTIQDFKEEFNPEVKVSGGVLIGFQLTGSIPKPDLNQLYIARPASLMHVNLSLTSMDGKYKAEMVLDFGESKSTWVEVSIPSERKEELKNYSTNELVAYAYTEIVDERSKRKRTFHKIYPTSWGSPKQPDEFVGRFYVISGIGLPKYTLNKKSYKCAATDADVNTAFNKFCVLNDSFSPGDNLVFLKTGVQRKFLVWRPE
ncbi:hypothetical protein [Glaciecola sp. KUL10]|uniref:hypothetical protein n=1 Tax=Glaciecola sp. (strain KUL10) TaxID=2161813 RepID=UPI000D781D92|nr:hypothetical protein [Glaciecola sp. KUL10]GBL05513.1 hypothetical protein KUL10_28340 [Glaciecola sp. KUL10]